MSERPSIPAPSPEDDAQGEPGKGGTQPLPEGTEGDPPTPLRDTEPKSQELFTPQPVASEAPTELSLPTPAPSGVAQGVPTATAAVRKVTLVSADEADGEPDEESPKASLRRAESYIGFIIDGRYHIQELLAQGGMGVVYRARHRVIDKPVAIKILRPELADNREITQRFLTEAQAASSIGNPHIVDITDFGELPDGATYIVMEFLEGEALSRRVAAHNRLTPDEIVAVARQTAEGLQGAHDAGIVHRDLKPDNIFLTQRGKDGVFVKVLDFGIAKVASSQNQVTRAGRIFGTPHYMSPEQARGEELDNRSDIYSMGVILYELLAGRVPFDGENPLGILTQHMYSDPVPLNELCPMDRVSVGLEAVVAKCLLKEPWKRYGSMAELDLDLARLQRGEQPVAVDELKRLGGSPSSLERRLLSAREPAKGRARSWLTAALVVFVVAAAGAFATPWAQPLRERAAALFPRSSADPMPTLEPAPTTAPTVPDSVEVALVLSPIDARVYSGSKDLGAMPLTLRIRRGQRITLAVKRPGYTTKRIEVDGKQRRLEVELSALPGAPKASAVREPVQAGGKPRVISFTDAGTAQKPRSVDRSQDAGAPKRPGRAPVSFDGDGGTASDAPKRAKATPFPSPTATATEPSASEEWEPAPLEPVLPEGPDVEPEEPIFEAIPPEPAERATD